MDPVAALSSAGFSSSSSLDSMSETRTPPNEQSPPATSRQWSPTSVIDAPSLAMPKLLAVFDIDGTLLVSHGREIITSADGLRCAVHPLVEPCGASLPKGVDSNFAYSGEEDLNGDAYALLQNALEIEPIAARMRELLEAPASEVECAILTARGHNPSWLAHALSTKLRLARPLSAECVKTVYSAGFESAMMEACGSLGRTADRKAFALGQLIGASNPTHVQFFDDMPSNLEKAASYMAKAHPTLVYTEQAVPPALATAACEANNVDLRELCHFQCRDDDGPPNSLVRTLLATELSASYGLREYARPPLAQRDATLPP